MKTHTRPIRLAAALLAAWFAQGVALAAVADQPPTTPKAALPNPGNEVRYRTVKVNGLDIFYSEAGPADGPTILLLHGFPSSSHMFRNLIPALADRYHVIAPDYPGFGRSSMPSVKEFEYSFDNLAKVVDGFTQAVGLKTFALYVQDYGAPVGYRIATAHPERITGLIVQNGNAYVEGLPDGFWAPLKEFWKNPTPELRTKLEGFLTLDTTKWQYLHGARNPENISPDAYLADQAGLDRPGNKDIQIELFKSYGTNPPLYPAWQEYFRKHQPPTLIVWGKNDQIFPAAGAEPYKRDLKNIDFNLLDTGHFALEEEGALIASKIGAWMDTRVAKGSVLAPAPAGGWDRFVFNRGAGFTDEGFYRAFKKAVPVSTMVVYCMDPRCVRVPEIVARAMPGEVYPGELIIDAEGRKVGSTATILPVVDAGARAVDALRSLAVGEHLFGLKNIVVVHHTNCGGSSFTNEGFVKIFNREHGGDISKSFDPRGGAITDLNKSVREDVALVRASPAVNAGVNIYGYVYDIDTEKLTLVVEEKGK